MRAGLSTIQQTLTPEAATVLNQSIAEAGRRSHGQTTPLHVAATLLASPSGYLRQACIRSHPNSSHPLQCRALELCFSVALDRLPSAQNLSPSLEPPISNALMAALKRAQAHQRRGCPEQQQQPLLAVKVELEQLIISILDDPSVSRVMREASFSSPAVKATIEQSLNSTNSVTPAPTIGSCGLGLGFRSQSINRNGSYLNPRLQSQGNSINSINSTNSANSAHSDQSGGQGGQRREEVKKVVDVMLRNKKRNPVLVGESEPELVVKELLQRIERKEVGECIFRNVQVVSLEKEFGSDRSQIPMKIKEIGGVIDTRISIGGGGVILNLGDLKWLVEQPVGFGSLGSGQLQQQMISETGKVAVVEMGKLLARFGVGNGKLWLIGTATCETYLRCQVYHPSMENDWDLQALPIAARAPLPGMFPRMGGNGILSSSVESLTPLKNYSTMTTPLQRQLSENMDPSRLMKCCHSCMRNYELELARLKAKEFEKSPSEAKPEPARQTLPQWLQIAKPDDGNIKSPTQSQVKDQELAWKQKTEELQRKWNDTCARLHPNFHHSINPERNALSALSMRNLYNPNPLGSQVFQPKSQLARNLGGTLRLQQTTVLEPCAEQVVAPPGSPVRTDLALGCPKISENTPEKTQGQQCVRNFIGQIPSESQERLPESKKDKLASILDPDSFKSLFKGLAEKVSWQNEAASAIAATVIECRSGNSKRQSVGGKGDAWLLFAGPDRVGKRKMAMALSELVCRRSPVIIQLGSRSNDMFRGKTSMDRVVEAVQRNPSSVVVLEDFDQADTLIRDSIKRAFERGRLPDFHGREVSLKNVIFILTANRLTENLKDSSDREQKLAGLCHNGCQLDLSVTSKTRKRSADWHQDSNRAAKSRTDAGSALAFDLNEEAEAEAEAEDDRAEGSLNSSDLTVEHDHEQNPLTSQSPIISIPAELLSCVDEAIVFKPVDFGPLQNKVANTITTKFSSIVGEKLAIEVENEALEQVLGSIWFGPTELEDWAEKILVPSFQKLKNTISSRVAMDEIENVIVRLASLKESGKSGNGDLLPSMIRVTTDGL